MIAPTPAFPVFGRGDAALFVPGMIILSAIIYYPLVGITVITSRILHLGILKA